jgi:hypothetical protein
MPRKPPLCKQYYAYPEKKKILEDLIPWRGSSSLKKKKEESLLGVI